MPDRIQLRRTKGWRLPPGARVVTRVTIFGNPWVAGDENAFWWPETGAHWRGSYHVPLRLMGDYDAVGIYGSWLAGRGMPDGVLPDRLTPDGTAAVRAALETRRQAILARLPELRGRDLACWCPPGCPCHADVLLERANA